MSGIGSDGRMRVNPNQNAQSRHPQNSATPSTSHGSGTFAAQSIPPTPSVPAMYMQAQDLPLVGLGYNSPRRMPSPMMPGPPNGNVPMSLRPPPGPQHPGQYGPNWVQHGTPSPRGIPPGQYRHPQGYFGPPSSAPGYAPRPGGPGPGPGPRFHGPQGRPQGPPPMGYGPPPRGQRSPPSRQYSGNMSLTGTPPQQRNPSAQRSPSNGNASPTNNRSPPGARHMQRPDTSATNDTEISAHPPVIELEHTLDFCGQLEEVGEVDEEAQVAPRPMKTPERHPDRVASSQQNSDSPGSAGFPEQVHVPRRRPHQDQNHQDDEVEAVSPISPDSAYGEDDFTVEPTSRKPDHLQPPPPSAVEEGKTSAEDFYPHLGSPRAAPAVPVAKEQVPSYDGSKGVFDRGNRQIVLFCIGFVMPLGKSFVIPMPYTPSYPQRLLTLVN